MAIPRVRTTQKVQLVYTEDSCVKSPEEGAPRWLDRQAKNVICGAGTDVVTVHPLGGSDLRALEALEAGQTDVAIVVRAFVDLNGDGDAIEKVHRFGRDVIVDLAREIRRLSNPVAAIVAKEAAESAGKSPDDAG